MSYDISSLTSYYKNKIYKKTLDLINDVYQKNFLVILLGNFNADLSKASNSSNLQTQRLFSTYLMTST
ncbi:14026_t:CDS:2 [Funneliformis caledonium]|uniref:14026_t:CDS:1 n=1 Tax=Funneliformis caledonium TaxID=1117310 RepID=A0A9N9FTU8_9GLOM|nr:14026_t:CDS:2 [Funneliformis caledonium]